MAAALILAACGNPRSTAVNPPSTSDSSGEANAATDAGSEADTSAAKDLMATKDLMVDVTPDTNTTVQCGPARNLSSGDDPVIDLFAVPAGIIAVRSQSLSLIERDGTVKTSVTAPREITAAAFDGQHLAVADRAMVVDYSPALVQMGQLNLTESCADAVIVSGHRFVCGPANDWDRVFYTYDLQTGAQLASSDEYTYNGIPMRRVPGTDYFVTVTVGSSPSDFHLYQVASDHKAVYIGESPYHGDISATMVFAFDQGSVHLINRLGTMLKIVGQNCNNSMASDCFVKDGVLGTLKAKEHFLALVDDGAGTLFSLTRSDSNSWDAPCGSGCAVQKIDVANRTIASQKTHTLPINDRGIKASAFDPHCPSLIIGYEEEGTTPAHRVDILDF